jgi:hypothetical protein
MSYGGIGSILGSIGGMALTPAMETYIQEMLRKGVTGLKDTGLEADTLDTLGNVAGGTLGTLLSTGLNAGLGYATGGKEGAAAGAVQGLIMGGGAALQHEDFLKSMGMDGAKAGTKPAPATAAASAYNTDQDISKITSPEAWTQQVNKGLRPLEGSSAAPEPAAPKTEATKIDIATPAKAEEEKSPGYFEMTGKLGLPAWALGAGIGSSMDYASRQEAFKKKLEAEKVAEAARMQQFYDMLGGMYKKAYAEGGMTVASNEGVPASVTFPDWFIEEFAGTGGLGAYATGGYINPQQFDPDMAYPQAMIQKAETYPGAAPIRNEVVNMERGGLLEGEGSGMSDDIPANIDGKEKVRVADGEFVVPADIAKRYGEDRLHAMMNKVRSAAHAKKGKQIVENAGKRAFIQSMSRVKA